MSKLSVSSLRNLLGRRPVEPISGDEKAELAIEPIACDEKADEASAERPGALFPDALDNYTQKPRAHSFALLGTCVAEGLSSSNNNGNIRIDHYLTGSMTHDEIPNLSWEQYDGVIVHVTLRHLLWEIVANGQDFFHVRTSIEYDSVLATAIGRLERLLEKITRAVGARAPLFFLAIIEPPSTFQGILVNNRRQSLYHFVRTLNDRMAELVDPARSTYYIETNDLLRYFGDANISDAYNSHLTHAGVVGSVEASTFYSNVISRVINAIKILNPENPIKLIISDLDNTLWKGVVAEYDDIIPHEHYEGWPLGYVEALLEFKRRGGLLALASKNDVVPTIERFKEIWKDRLQIDDFCSIKINWNAKSKNIDEILMETNLLPSNVLFIDDNPREIEEVKRAFPEMRFLTGRQEDWRSVILFSPQTQVASISAESAERTKLIQEKQHRDQLSRELNREDFLKSLKITVDFFHIRNSAHPRFERAFELLNKTNQFNTTGRRWRAAELELLFKEGGVILALSSKDALGDNGLVALAILHGADIQQVVMSCRVFGFGLEIALLCEAFISVRGTATDIALTGKYVDTGKNKASASYFESNGFKKLPDCVGIWHLVQPPIWPDWIGRSN